MAVGLFPEAPIASVHALFDEDGVKPNPGEEIVETLWEADIITAVDHMTQCETVLFGRKLIEQVRRSDHPRWVRVLRIGLDRDTDELARLKAIIKAVKGRCDLR